MSALILATRNEHKLRELREALPGVEIEPLPEAIELPRGRRDVRRERASQGAGGARGDRARRDRR